MNPTSEVDLSRTTRTIGLLAAGIAGALALLALALPATKAGASGERGQLEQVATSLRSELRAERRRSHRLRGRLARERTRSRRALARARRSGPSDIERALRLAGAAYDVSAPRLRRIAHCESRLVPTASAGPYLGLFQFGTPLWSRTPYARFSRTDPYAAAMAAGWAFARRLDSHWPVCGRR